LILIIGLMRNHLLAPYGKLALPPSLPIPALIRGVILLKNESHISNKKLSVPKEASLSAENKLPPKVV